MFAFELSERDFHVMDFFGEEINPPTDFRNGLVHSAGNQRNDAEEQQHLPHGGSQPSCREVFWRTAKVTPHDKDTVPQVSSPTPAYSANLAGQH